MVLSCLVAFSLFGKIVYLLCSLYLPYPQAHLGCPLPPDDTMGIIQKFLVSLIASAINDKIDADKIKAAAKKVESSRATAETALKFNISGIADSMSASSTSGHKLNITHLMAMASSHPIPPNVTEIIIFASKPNLTDADAARLAEVLNGATKHNLTEMARTAAAKHNSTTENARIAAAEAQQHATEEGKGTHKPNQLLKRPKSKRNNNNDDITRHNATRHNATRPIIKHNTTTTTTAPRLWHDLNSTRLPCDPFVLNTGNDCIHGVNFTALVRSEAFWEYMQTKGLAVKQGKEKPIIDPVQAMGSLFEMVNPRTLAKYSPWLRGMARYTLFMLFPAVGNRVGAVVDAAFDAAKSAAGHKPINAAAGNKTITAAGNKTATATVNYTLTATLAPKKTVYPKPNPPKFGRPQCCEYSFPCCFLLV